MAKKIDLYEMFAYGKIIITPIFCWNSKKQTKFFKKIVEQKKLGSFIFKKNKEETFTNLKGKKKLLSLHILLNICLKIISQKRKLNDFENEIFQNCIKNDFKYKIHLKDDIANQFYKDFVVDQLEYY